MKLSGYIILTLWIAALFGVIYYIHLATQDARTELLGMVLLGDTNPQSAAAPAPQTSFVEEGQAGAVSEEVLRGQLAGGLASLKTTLEGYSVKLAQAETAGSTPGAN